MHQLIVLQGGDDIRKRTNQSLMSQIARISSTKRVLVIPWTNKPDDREEERRELLTVYFKESGFREVLFLERDDSEEEVSAKMSQVDVVYLPGGDPSTLYEEMRARSLQQRLRDFKGIIVGNSAGAIVLSRGAEHEGKFYQGFGLADFFISVHYDLRFESGLGGGKPNDKHT
ncbi:MAG: Type 1 glutamine amidotransferase-like domain-containing protein [Thermoprotei archaeon]